MKTASILISLATIGTAAASQQTTTTTKLDNDGSDSISAGGIRASKLVTSRTNNFASSSVSGGSTNAAPAATKQQKNNDKLNLLKHQNIPTLSYEASKRNEVTRRHEIGEELRKKVYELKKMEAEGGDKQQQEEKKIEKKTRRKLNDTGSKSTTKKKTQAANNMKRRNLVETKKRIPSSTTPIATDNSEEKGKVPTTEEEERILKKTKSDKGGGDWGGSSGWDKGWQSSNSHDNWGKPSGGWNDDDDDWFNKGWSKPSGGWGSSNSHDSSWGKWGSGKANKGSGDWGWGGSGKSGKSGGGSWGNDWGWGSGKSGKSGGSGWGWGSGKAGKGSWGGDNWGSGKAGKGWGSHGGGWNSHHWNGGGWCGDQAYVTVTNLSFKQSFSEIFAMTALWKVTDDKPIYVFGDHANEGLRELSTNADAGEMEDRYKDKWGVEQVKTFKDFDFGPIDNRFLNGGASATFKVRTSGFGEYLSIAVGLPFTNDGAVVLQGVPIYDGAEYYIPAIDAGVEGNIQTCWSVEARADEFPPNSQCYNENNADDNINDFGGEGYVGMHRGIQDLDNGNELADLLEFVECDDIDDIFSSPYPYVEYFATVGFNHPILFCKDYYDGMDFIDCDDIFDEDEFIDNIDDLPEALQDSILIELARISDGDFVEFCDLISDANKKLEDGFKVLEPWFFDWRNEIMKVDVKCWLDDGWGHDGWGHDGWSPSWSGDDWGSSHWGSSSSSSSRSYDLDSLDWDWSLDDNRKKNGKN